MLYNLRNLWKYDGMFDWPCLFGVTVWRLWFWRNQNLHNGVFTSNSKSTVVMDIKIRTEEIQKVNQSCLVPAAMKIENILDGWHLLGLGLNSTQMELVKVLVCLVQMA